MKRIIYEKILVPHDGSRLASTILPHIVAIEGGFNAEIILVQAVESLVQLNARLEPIPSFAAGFNTVELVRQMSEAEQKSAQKNLDKIKDQLKQFGISHVTIKTVQGIPGDEIVALAKKEKCDLIMMSTHGRSGLGRVLLGSVADHVARHAHCPVLLVRPQGI